MMRTQEFRSDHYPQYAQAFLQHFEALCQNPQTIVQRQDYGQSFFNLLVNYLSIRDYIKGIINEGGRQRYTYTGYNYIINEMNDLEGFLNFIEKEIQRTPYGRRENDASLKNRTDPNLNTSPLCDAYRDARQSYIKWCIRQAKDIIANSELTLRDLDYRDSSESEMLSDAKFEKIMEIPQIKNLEDAMIEIKKEHERLLKQYPKNKKNKKTNELESVDTRVQILEKTIGEMQEALNELKKTLQNDYGPAIFSHYQNLEKKHSKDINTFREIVSKLSTIPNYTPEFRTAVCEALRIRKKLEVAIGRCKRAEDSEIFRINSKIGTTYDEPIGRTSRKFCEIIENNILKNDNATTSLKKFFGRVLTIVLGVMGTPLLLAGPAALIYRAKTRPHGGWLMFDSKTQEAGKEAVEKTRKFNKK